MNYFRTLFGLLLFWASWPALFVYLRGSLRTRVIIQVGNDILMLRGWHDGNNWSLPGGGVHKSETSAVSAVREVLEETGIVLEESELIDLGTDVFSQRGLSFKIQRYGYRLSERPKTQKQHLEVIALAWLSLDDISEDMVDEATWRHLQAWKQQR